MKKNKWLNRRISIGILLIAFVLMGCGNKEVNPEVGTQYDEYQQDNSSDKLTDNGKSYNESLVDESLEGENDQELYDEEIQEESPLEKVISEKNTTTGKSNVAFSKDSDFIHVVENDPALINLYYQFKYNNIVAEMDEQYSSNTYSEEETLNKEPFNIDNLKQYVEKNYFTERGKEKAVYSISYSYLDCGADGIPEMAIRFDNLNIYCEDDGSYVVYIFKQINDKLYLTYSFESWPRCEVSMDWYGHIWSSGSAGAGDIFIDEGILDSDGRFHMINSEEQLTGWWISYVNEDVYNEIFSNGEEEQTRFNIFRNKIGEEKYYSYILDEEDNSQRELCNQYISGCEDKGVAWLSRDEINSKVEEYKKSLKLPEFIYHRNDIRVNWEEIL